MTETLNSGKQMRRGILWMALSGAILGVLWIIVYATSSTDLSVGWIIHIVLLAVANFQLTQLNRVLKVKPLTWVLFVLAIVSAVVAYTLSLIGVSATTVGLIAGIVSGGFLFLTGVWGLRSGYAGMTRKAI